MLNASTLLLIPLLPLLSFLFISFIGNKYLPTLSGTISVLVLSVSAFLAIAVAYNYFFIVGMTNGIYETIIPMKFEWLRFSPGVSIDMGIILDPISVMMLVVVTFISLMVHIYSLGYMKGEERFAVYYSFLDLFTFSMLGLVMASNLFQMYFFWELVGVSSYLLIGYYFTKPSAVAAAKKAFIVTRFADLGFLIGILVLSLHSGTLDIQTLIARLTTSDTTFYASATFTGFMGVSSLTWGLALVFIGGAGKSAMFPLHIWLPDAMEGPTPVSALIHAATMVVAGVYLVARLFPIYAISSPHLLELIGYIGIISSVLAAIIACTQTDIKRVLAYSTISQIGYMLASLGVSTYGGLNGEGFSASMFHLFTHAFFKALLFLCAGSVIHYVHSNEVKDMGGLRKKMPITHLCFLLACLAIAGIPPLSGFFSKEEILAAAFAHNQTIFYIAWLTAGLTSFYMFRLYFLTFWNKDYVNHHESHEHHSEGSWNMKLPLLILMLGAVGAGVVPFHHLITSDGQPYESEFHLNITLMAVGLSLFAIIIATIFYRKKNNLSDKISSSISQLYDFAYHKFYFDEVYQFVTQRILFNTIGALSSWFDKNIVNGVVNTTAFITEAFSETIKPVQSGKVQGYALAFLFGILGLIAILFFFNF